MLGGPALRSQCAGRGHREGRGIGRYRASCDVGNKALGHTDLSGVGKSWAERIDVKTESRRRMKVKRTGPIR